jgi:acetyltransferase-like isoleucine patch superfamily enzyme
MAGWRNVSLGARTVVSDDVWFNCNFRDEQTLRIVVGDDSHIGRRNFFSAGPLIRLGDFFFSGVDCRFLGCGHVIENPRVPYRTAGLTQGAPIELEANCWLTTGVTVMEGVRIGRGSVIGAASVVVNSVPPFSVAVGTPCTVIRRYDFRANAWVSAREWSDASEPFQPTEAQYLEQLRSDFAALPPALASASRRFGWI